MQSPQLNSTFYIGDILMLNNTYIGSTEFDFINEEGDIFVDSVSAGDDAPYVVALGKTAVEM